MIPVPEGAVELRATMSYFDRPGSEVAGGNLPVNDIDLVLVDPSGVPEYRLLEELSRTNNVEKIVLANPVPAGNWRLRIVLHRIPGITDWYQDFDVFCSVVTAKPRLTVTVPDGVGVQQSGQTFALEVSLDAYDATTHGAWVAALARNSAVALLDTDSGNIVGDLLAGQSSSVRFNFRFDGTSTARDVIWVRVGTTEKADPDSFFVDVYMPPSAPPIVSPGSASPPGPVISTSTLTFQWSSVTDASSYGLYVYDSGSNLVYKNESISGPSTSFQVDAGQFAPGQSYTWKMRANNPAGWSPSYSAPRYFQVAGSSRPYDVRVLVLSCNSKRYMSDCRHEQTSGSHKLESRRRACPSPVAPGRKHRTTHDRASSNRLVGRPGAEHRPDRGFVADAARSSVEMAATLCSTPSGRTARWLALGQASALRLEHRKAPAETTGSTASSGP